LLASLRNIAETYGLTGTDVAMVVMPLFHVHGLIGVALSTLASGGTIVLPPRFSASSFWQIQRQTGATWYSGVPTIHKILVDRADIDGAPTKSFRFIRSCSAPMSPAAIAAVEARFGAPFLEAYGMTEASHQMSSNPMPPGDRRPGTAGAGTGVGVSIRDESGAELAPGQQGEVCVSGPNVTHGYANNPEANATAFWGEWFRTGDQGVLTVDGYLTLTGRLKELINRAGEKISPLEVDEALLGHPAVAEAVSFAVPDPMYGECVHAAVVLSGEATEDDIKAFCAEKLAPFKVPDAIYIAQELPRTATGKIQRRHVAAKFAG
jgi:acyl-CoA synthetase (AMP-forming)/AMP-acid ligase II